MKLKDSIMKKFLIATFYLIAVAASAQEVLSFEMALAKTLENNYDIRLSKIDESIADNNAQPSANGYLPTLTGSGGYGWTFYNGQNKLVNGEQNFNANSSYNYNAGIRLSYSIFDGFGRRSRYELAEGNLTLSQLELRRIMETAVVELSQIFHEVARLQQQTTSLDSTLSISQQRLIRAEYGYEYGQTTQLDILNARVDFNTDSINLLNSRQTEENTKRNLNLIMGEPIEQVYQIVEDVQLRELMSSEEVVSASLENGSPILVAEQAQKNANIAIAVNKAVWYPNLNVNGGYDFQGSENPNGAFVLGNRFTGPTAGVTLSWTIFDGRNKTNVRNAELAYESSGIQLEQTRKQTTTFALNAHGAYRNALYILEASSATVETAQDNFERTAESFQIGQISSVQFRQAQVNLLRAELQLSQALFDAKNAELQMLVLMGQLLD